MIYFSGSSWAPLHCWPARALSRSWRHAAQPFDERFLLAPAFRPIISRAGLKGHISMLASRCQRLSSSIGIAKPAMQRLITLRGFDDVLGSAIRHTTLPPADIAFFSPLLASRHYTVYIRFSRLCAFAASPDYFSPIDAERNSWFSASGRLPVAGLCQRFTFDTS